MFSRYIINKRRIKENLHTLWNVRENIVMKDEDKDTYLMPFLSQSLLIRPIVVRGPRLLSWKMVTGKEMRFL